MKDSKSYSAQKHALHNLVQTIVNGEKGSIQAALDELGVGKNRQLKSELEAIQEGASYYSERLLREFQSTDSMAQTSLADATEKLSAIIELTENSANTVIGLAEEQESSLREAERYLHKMKNQLDADPTIAWKTRESFETLYQRQLQLIALCTALNQNILMAQSYQDLAGQHAKKVIRMIDNVKRNIVGFFSLFRENSETNVIELNDDSKHTADSKDEGVSENEISESLNQDDVDDVLKSLDF